VLTISVSEAAVTPDCLAAAGTEQIRPDTGAPFGLVTTHFLFCKRGRKWNRLWRDRNLGEDHPANVRSDAYCGGIFV